MSLSAASDPARRAAPRALGRRHARLVRAAACALVAALLPLTAAQAQNTDTSASGQIYIPGPGEAKAVKPSGAMISIPGPGQAQASASAGTATNGMIVIPGPGEARGAAPANVPPIVSEPHPAIATAASRVIPVVVTAPQRSIRAAQPIAPASVGGPTRPTAPAAATAAALAPASDAPAGQEDSEAIRRAALAYLQQQTIGLPGKISITVAPTFPRGLAACTTLEPFMPTGARLWGTTSVGVRCAGAKPWTLYLRARIAIDATYYLAARQIEPGTVVTAQDLLARDGDLSNLPRAIITDPSQAIGSTALARISAGMPLRQDLLKSASAVAIGQTVRVIAQGQGFTISSEGSVMNNAAPGQEVRVRLAGGQIISGIVRDAGTVQVQM